MKIFKIARFILTTLSVIVGLLILVFTWNYITCPVYKFTKFHPFKGDSLYNPYEHINPDWWRKANFQVQSRAWGGITSGRGNSNTDIYNTYKSLGYDVIATSDYQKINRYRQDDPSYIPVYEHGYNIPKSHQVLLNANRVLWKDYPFFQTIHNKQNILNKLRQGSELTYLAHPKLRRGYSLEEMKYLTNYDGIEVLNNYRTSTEHWDAALSAGNYVTLIGDDDVHDIFNPDEIGHHCTLINAPSTYRRAILNALKSGAALGAKIWRPQGESLDDKIKRIKLLPNLLEVNIKNDSLFIITDSLIKEIRFIGQNGKVIKTENEIHEAFIPVKAIQTYVRTEIDFDHGITFYLNPVCRFDGNFPAQITLPEIDWYRTTVLRIVGFATIVFLIANIILIRGKRRRKSGKH